jgi:Asp-tRNA(Asn)/Glu-tRNA(Gln) amidotransferase A subunit family amidase
MKPYLLSAKQLIDKVKKSELSSVEVANSFIERIEEFEKKVHAWAFFDKTSFLEKAKEADDWRLSGKPLGPLHGLPVAIKDIFKTDDMPTGYGTPIKEGQRSKNESEVVKLLKNAGAIIMGKTVTTELAYFDPGKTTNPNDYSRTPGGSSSGSAAAVASFMAPVAIGSQTNGSMIRPASYCGVIGYKPSYGLISRSGVLRLSFLLDQIGIFGRTIEDMGLISKIIMSKDPKDKSTRTYPTENMESSVLQDHPFDPKFVFVQTPKWKNLDDDSKKAFDKLRKKLEKNVVDFQDPSSFEKIFEYQQVIMETDMAHNLSYFYEAHKNKIGKKLREAIERGQSYKSKDYAEAVDNIETIYDNMSELFNHFHAIITPATTGEAPKGLAHTGSPEFCTIWTYLGMPSISLPILEGSNKMPIGVQVVGEKFDDVRFLRSANWLFKKLNK